MNALNLVHLALKNSDGKFKMWLAKRHKFFIDFVMNEVSVGTTTQETEKEGKGCKISCWNELVLQVEWKWLVLSSMKWMTELDKSTIEMVMRLTAVYPE